MIQIINADVIDGLKQLPDKSIQCVVTSPPYWSLRDYGVKGQIGLEKTPEEYVAKLVSVFQEVKRVLRDDGTLWLNLGDSYGSGSRKTQVNDSLAKDGKDLLLEDRGKQGFNKQLIGIPWRVAFALQEDGWYLRSDIIWSKPNPMPESVKDRPTKAHEYIFLLTKNARYFYDTNSVMEPISHSYSNDKRPNGVLRQRLYPNSKYMQFDYGNNQFKVPIPGSAGSGFKGHSGYLKADGTPFGTRPGFRNKRTVWEITTQPTPEAHFATFPEALVEPCIKAGSKTGDIILDPFGGSGTVAKVARDLKRDSIMIEINPEYVKIMRKRLRLNEQLVVG